MNKRGKKLLHFILVAILAIQPVFFSYAMAGMGHGQHHQTEMNSSPSHDHHSMHHTNFDDSTSQHGSFSDDCCDNAACGFATIHRFELTILQHDFEYTSFLTTAKPSADLSGELRPPRS